MSWQEDLEKLTEKAMATEAPADVRAFAKRYRNLYVAMLQEGFDLREIGQLLAIPIIIHLNGPDLGDGS